MKPTQTDLHTYQTHFDLTKYGKQGQCTLTIDRVTKGLVECDCSPFMASILHKKAVQQIIAMEKKR